MVLKRRDILCSKARTLPVTIMTGMHWPTLSCDRPQDSHGTFVNVMYVDIYVAFTYVHVNEKYIFMCIYT